MKICSMGAQAPPTVGTATRVQANAPPASIHRAAAATHADSKARQDAAGIE